MSTPIELQSKWKTLPVTLTGSAQAVTLDTIWVRSFSAVARVGNAGAAKLGTDIGAQNLALPWTAVYVGQPVLLGDWFVNGTANDLVDIYYI